MSIFSRRPSVTAPFVAHAPVSIEESKISCDSFPSILAKQINCFFFFYRARRFMQFSQMRSTKAMRNARRRTEMRLFAEMQIASTSHKTSSRRRHGDGPHQHRCAEIPSKYQRKCARTGTTVSPEAGVDHCRCANSRTRWQRRPV